MGQETENQFPFTSAAGGKCERKKAKFPVAVFLPLFQTQLVCAAALAIGSHLRAAAFTDANWTSAGSGLDRTVLALAISGSDAYAGGAFTNAGGTPVNYIAKWSGGNWSALGSGMNTNVRALAFSGGNLYAAGSFTTAGGNAANRVAKWDGNNWTALGSGVNSDVYALAVSGSDLYVGGAFTTAGGAPASRIAKWDGNSWTALGSGVTNYPSSPLVNALAVSGSDLFVGGNFATAGGNTVNYISKWDGNSWSALGSGMGGGILRYVYALAVSGTDLYAGGLFTWATNSGGVTVPATNIAKWNGSTWTGLASGLSGTGLGVNSLAVSSNGLYVGGWFATAGGSPANSIARWDGSSWSALGSGVAGSSPIVYALALLGNDLYAGGAFTNAGGKAFTNIARAYLLPRPTLSVVHAGSNVMVSWPSGDTAGFTLQRAGTMASPSSWVSNTSSINDDGTNKSVTMPATNNAQFFRLFRP